MSDTCVVNYSTGWFVKGQNRLKQACIDVGYKGDFLLFGDDRDPGQYLSNKPRVCCPPHSQVPYGFKPWSMKAVQALGYRYILWCDSSVYPERPLDAVWKIIQDQGYLFFPNGYNCGQWTSDPALETLGITREEAFGIPNMIAGCQGIDLGTEKGKAYLDRLFALSNDGITFYGDWTNERGQVSSDKRVLGSRHDQSAASVVAWQLGMRDWKINMVIYDEKGTVLRRPEMIFVVRSA